MGGGSSVLLLWFLVCSLRFGTFSFSLSVSIIYTVGSSLSTCLLYAGKLDVMVLSIALGFFCTVYFCALTRKSFFILETSCSFFYLMKFIFYLAPGRYIHKCNSSSIRTVEAYKLPFCFVFMIGGSNFPDLNTRIFLIRALRCYA